MAQKDRLTIFQQRKEGEPMSDAELTVSHPVWIKVDLEGANFNGLVEAISAAAAQACGELLAQATGGSA